MDPNILESLLQGPQKNLILGHSPHISADFDGSSKWDLLLLVLLFFVMSCWSLPLSCVFFVRIEGCLVIENRDPCCVRSVGLPSFVSMLSKTNRTGSIMSCDRIWTRGWEPRYRSEFIF